jgi:hypothetical protein
MQLNWQASLNLTFNVKQNRLTSLYVTMFNTFPVRLSANHKAQPKSMTHNWQQVKNHNRTAVCSKQTKNEHHLQNLSDNQHAVGRLS